MQPGRTRAADVAHAWLVLRGWMMIPNSYRGLENRALSAVAMRLIEGF